MPDSQASSSPSSSPWIPPAASGLLDAPPPASSLSPPKIMLPPTTSSSNATLAPRSLLGRMTPAWMARSSRSRRSRTLRFCVRTRDCFRGSLRLFWPRSFLPYPTSSISASIASNCVRRSSLRLSAVLLLLLLELVVAAAAAAAAAGACGSSSSWLVPPFVLRPRFVPEAPAPAAVPGPAMSAFLRRPPGMVQLILLPAAAQLLVREAKMRVLAAAGNHHSIFSHRAPWPCMARRRRGSLLVWCAAVCVARSPDR